MKLPRCPDCGEQLERLDMPNGGYIYVRTCPGHMVIEESGPHEAIHPRTLKLVRGRLVTLTQAIDAQNHGQQITRVWLRHPRHPDNKFPPPPTAKERKPAEVGQGTLF